jgi:hypothetical protein
VQEHAARHARADAREALRALEELDELLDLLDRLVAAGDVAERDLGTGLVGHLGVGAQRAAAPARDAGGVATPEGHDQHHEREEDQPHQRDADEAEARPAVRRSNVDRGTGLGETVGEVLRGWIAERLLAPAGEPDAYLRSARVEHRLAHRAALDGR